jgi:hypothetical protein
MLIALAMMAQDMTLNPEGSAAMTCARASNAAAAPSEEEAITTMFGTIYFLMRAADADRAGTGLVPRATALAPEMVKNLPAAAERGAILAECDRRYPLARSTAPVKLPTDPYAHDLMCVAATSYFIGALNGSELPARVPEIRKIQSGYSDRLSDAQFAAHGVTTQDNYNNALGESLRATLRIGNLEQVVKACISDLPGR